MTKATNRLPGQMVREAIEKVGLQSGYPHMCMPDGSKWTIVRGRSGLHKWQCFAGPEGGKRD